MFLGKVTKEGKSATVISKATGEKFRARLWMKSYFGPDRDLFILSTKDTPVYRDSLRRRYVEA